MARVKCHKCGHVNEEGQDRCASCGAGLPKVKIKSKGAARPAEAGGGQQFARGQVVADRYTVQQLIGRGGMGCIYRVQDKLLGEAVALKTLLPQFVKDQVVVERFFNEAKIARRLAHPGIVRVHDIGSADGTVYISMEFLEGRSLRGILDNLPLGARMPLGQVLRVFDELCAALEYAHRFTIHRDIKPENVMILPDGSVKLMDFGISKLMANTRLTGASVVMGTPFYMSPEQLRNSRDVDQRADLYSVGVMLYEVLTGNLPTGVPKPASQLHPAVPLELDRFIERCVDPEPANRFQTAAELRAALRPILERATAREQATIHRENTPRPARAARSRLAGAVLCMAVAAFMVLGLGVAEQARGRLLADAPTGVADDPAEAEWNLLGALWGQARRMAMPRAESSPDIRAALTEADTRWEQARSRHAADDLAGARALGLGALQCAVAAATWEDGMAFVPPGPAPGTGAWMDGFFIDRTEVTIGAYQRFCEKTGGVFALPPELAGLAGDAATAKMPLCFVTGYEAMAYAAHLGRQLPTEAQWRRAACGDAGTPFPWGDAPREEVWMGYLHPVAHEDTAADVSPYGCRDMLRNVAEWTRTVPGRAADALPEVGDSLLVCGGHYAEPLRSLMAEATAIPFHLRSATVGLRCVRTIPRDLGVISAQLDVLAAAS